MAIPFYIPTDQETESQYRSMDDLFAQLYNVLRQIMLHRPATPVVPVQRTSDEAAASIDRLEPVAVLPDVVPDASRLAAAVPHASRTPQPDLVASLPSQPSRRRDASTATPSTPLPPPRRGRRRRAPRHRADDDAPAAPTAAKGGVKEVFECRTYTSYRPEVKVEVRDNWTQVGEDLRRIADDFQSSIESLEHKPLSDPPKSMSSLLSLLVPSPPYTGSIWMTVILILGWGVLQRTR